MSVVFPRTGNCSTILILSKEQQVCLPQRNAKRPDSSQVKGGIIIMTGKEEPEETRVPSLCHQTTEIMDLKEFKFHW